MQEAKLLLLAIGLQMSGCNHLFYYPSPVKVTTPDREGIAYEALRIPSEDSVTLDAWWMKPQPHERRGRLVVQLHGNAENISTHFRFVSWLVAEGYDVLTFDYRGYGDSSPVAPTQEGLVSDTCAVLAWLQQSHELKELPAFMIGQSLGGAVAITSLARCPYPQLRGLLIDSSFHSYRGIAQLKLASFWLSWPLQYPLSLLISEDAGSPADAVRAIRGVPLLFFHSPRDPVVPYESGRRLFKQAPEPKQWVDVGFVGHLGALSDGSPYRRTLLEFFERSLSQK